jgi:hypothetical protein
VPGSEDDRRLRSDARNQHHVPQLLLRPFATPGKGKKHQVCVFDKHEGRSFRASIEKVFAERDFNTFEADNATLCLEDGIAAIENVAAPIFRKIVDTRTLKRLTDSDREILDAFVALQKVRGVAMRAQMLDMRAVVKQRIQQMGGDPDAIPQLRGADRPEAIKLSALGFVRDHMQEFSKCMAVKDLVLFEPCEGGEFLLGDNPVTWHNYRDMGPYGNLGLKVPGIELYLPLAPTLTLSLWCPSNIPKLRKDREKFESAARQATSDCVLSMKRIPREIRDRRTEWETSAENLKRTLNLIERGDPVRASQDNTTWFNSLQVGQAERYLVSASGDFSLAHRMIADNPRYRKGHRIEFR